jgi:hypothetical protein
MFVLFTGLGVADLYRQYRHNLADHKRLVIVALFTLVCGYFTVHSFIKANRTVKRRK